MRPPKIQGPVTAATLALLLLGLPLAGAMCVGTPLECLTEFPPKTLYIAHAPFAWPVFAGLAILILAAVLPVAWRMWRAPGTAHNPNLRLRPTGFFASTFGHSRTPEAGRRLPWWGWAALAFGIGAWVLAWTRFAWFRPLQSFTFSPLWVAYIGVVNALTQRRSGRCLLTEASGRMLLLAAASAVFWWYFEYLNRFVQNWTYLGVDNLSAGAYALFATLPFATVLPAIVSTEEWLATFPRLTAGLATFRPVRLPPAAGVWLCAIGAAALLALPCFPNALFPLLWIAPALLLAGQALGRGRPCVLDGMAAGDLSRLVRLALAGLVCGFFWEMWNCWSLAKWQYAVPYVNRFHIFEMPVLGYAGYLPFGIECALVADALLGRRRTE